jgi:hypothetical protein
MAPGRPVRVHPSEGEAALAAYRRERDIHALEQAMERLDAEETSTRASTKLVSPDEAIAWLHDLPWLAMTGDLPSGDANTATLLPGVLLTNGSTAWFGEAVVSGPATPSADAETVAR